MKVLGCIIHRERMGKAVSEMRARKAMAKYTWTALTTKYLGTLENRTKEDTENVSLPIRELQNPEKINWMVKVLEAVCS